MPGKIKKSFQRNQKRKDQSPQCLNRSKFEDKVGPSGSASQPLHLATCSLKPIQNSAKSCDKGGVKRIFSPFNRFALHTSRSATKRNNVNRTTYKSIYPSTGLSPKEKSYIISSCQTRFSRYTQLKNLAKNAIKNNKVFLITGICKPVEKALTERGWVEKIPPNRMNLSKIRNGIVSSQTQIQDELEKLLLSNFVEKHTANFIWCTGEETRDTTIDMTKDGNTIINKLKIDTLWTTKQGLCASMKSNYWHYIEDISEVNSPRTYNSDDADEMDEFTKDFKITACTSLLKWVLSMMANERPIFTDDGNVSINVFIFAMNRCKEYLMKKQHRDIDKNLETVTIGQWNTFLKHYYNIIERQAVFEKEEDDNLKLYTSYSKFLLKEMFVFRPQLSCEGCCNIWIVKPAHCSRGRGIRMAAKLNVIEHFISKANAKYVVQKYIEDPLLIYDTKFDIRQYYLVTNTCPLTIWMYKDCYLKFSSQIYSLKNYHESVHLTNNAVQKKYKNCTGRHPELPFNNMWDSEKYNEYLDKIGKGYVWDNIIYPGMKKSIIGIMLSCQDSLYMDKNRFELYGCDFVLDKDYKPWLIEINSRPDLKSTTQVTGKICPAVISDIIKVVIDFARNPKASTGGFECIYKQPVTVPRYGTVTDLVVNGNSLPSNYFYQGNIKIKEPPDDPFFGKKPETHDSDSDIMVEPNKDDIGSCYASEKMDDKLNISVTNEDLQTEATFPKINVKKSEDSIISQCFDSETSCKRDSYTALPLTKSQIAIESIESSIYEPNYGQRTRNRSNSMYECNPKEFTFSKLDDNERGSVRGSNSSTEFSGSSNEHIGTRFTKVTSRILSFIKAKEKEYVRDLCIPKIT